MNIQGWLPLGLIGLISLLSKVLSRIFSSTTITKRQLSGTQLSVWSNSLIHIFLLETQQLWLDGPLSAKGCLCFLIHEVCHSFPSKEQESLNFMPAVTISNDFEAPKIKIYHCSQFFPYLPWSDGTRCHDLRFLHVEFQASFFSLLFHPPHEAL